ncbi:restriction endonuclease subunit S [uncultured Prevotella sp.]|uniref:restriction endonuclease subunit S n=1 Tax=uncultured Prevotella sp. TaxID=159272 RepID=UPI002672ECFA|nr:restriction endonuclease subunit S [uncultured Prevotella sp.]
MWEKTKFGDIAIVVGGGTPDTNTSQYWNGKIQWFTPSEIGRNKYVYNSVRTISEEGLNKSSAKLLPIGTILLSSRATVGECSINKKECTTNQGFQSLIPKENISNEFVYYLIQTKRKDLIRKSCGSTFLEISANEVRKIVVSIPTIKEQDKIAKLLSLLDERIATQNKIIEDLKKLKSAIIDYAINSLDSGFVKFGSLYEMAGEGGTPTTSNASFYDNGKIPFIKIDDLKKKYLTENKDFITELGLQKSSAWLVPSRSILFSNGATIGEITITTYPVCTKQGILGIVPKQNIDVEFLYYFMSSSYFKKAVSRIVTEGTMKTAYLKDINNILCPIPTKEKQQEIAKMPSALNSKIDFEQSILKLFCSQKQYLLRQMFI